MSLRWWFGWCL